MRQQREDWRNDTDDRVTQDDLEKKSRRQDEDTRHRFRRDAREKDRDKRDRRDSIWDD